MLKAGKKNLDMFGLLNEVNEIAQRIARVLGYVRVCLTVS